MNNSSSRQSLQWQMSLSPPFVEELIPYDPKEFDFVSHIQDILEPPEAHIGDLEQAEGEGGLATLSQIHRWFRHSGKRRPRMRCQLVHTDFIETYHRFVRTVVRSNLEEAVVLFEHCPNLRIHLAGEKSLTAPHRDKDHHHSEAELNFWVPLTSCCGGASLWVESMPGKGDFHALTVEPGVAVRFYGNQCLHFTKDNDTDLTRVSFDFRVVRLRDLGWSKIPHPGSPEAARWMIFSYYDVMGADGRVLSPDEWASQVAPCLPDLSTTAGNGYHQPARPTSCRQRSRSPEHLKKCEAKWGSARHARKNCARCGWLANRAQLEQVLCYMDSSGITRPWVVENPDSYQPWGLGCLLCHRAFLAGPGDQSTPWPSKSAFTDFTYGLGMPGLLQQPLCRHGNHARLQAAGRIQTQLVLPQNPEHAAAAAAAQRIRL